MNILAKLKETTFSVIPIVIIVLVLNITIAPIGWMAMGQFSIGAVLIILGLSLFLHGTDIGIIPVGQAVGSALTNKRNLTVMLIVGFLVGFFITVAEPDVQVLATQAATVDPGISKTLLVLMIALGVGLFIAMGFMRVILHISYRWMLVIFYGIVMILAFITNDAYLGIAFDAGGATTGPMTVPFIMALGIGVASVRKQSGNHEDSFGLVGLASIGPILAVLIMGLINYNGSQGTVASESANHGDLSFIHLLSESTIEVSKALGPLLAMFLVFQFALLRMRALALARMFKGLIYAFIGLVLFFLGVNGAFLPIGSEIGSMVGALPYNWVLIPIGVALGAVVVLAEPAVWVLTEQIEEISGGQIARKVILVFLSIGVALAIGLAMVRVVTGINIFWFLIPGYLGAIILTFFSPRLYTAIAFDSGGVASGPMSSTFVLSFTLGASIAVGGNPISDAFGVIAMIAMIPLSTLQILGILVKRTSSKRRTHDEHTS